MGMMVRAILFDNDGILVDTERLYLEANRTILQSLDLELSAETYRRGFLVQNSGITHLLRELGHDETFIRAQREARDDLYETYLRERSFAIEGAEEVLGELSIRYLVGIVTSSKRRHFDVIHGRTGFLRHVDFVVGEGDYGRSKPDPEPYVVAVGRTGFRPEECLAIEDSERGLTAAKGAGCACWVVPNALTRDSDFSNADRVFERLIDVVDRL